MIYRTDGSLMMENACGEPREHQEVVDETTPQHDDIDLALTWIADNPDADVRRVIITFSDDGDRNVS
ncbi:MAG: hypothetical protein ACP5HG_00160 [Anaerolineae bacterium]